MRSTPPGCRQRRHSARKRGRSVDGLQMLEVVLDMDAARRPIAKRQAVAAIDAHRHAGRREEVEIDPAFLAERSAADIDQHAGPLPQGALLGDAAGKDAVQQTHRHRIQLDTERPEHPRIDRQPRDQPGAQALLQRRHGDTCLDAKARATEPSNAAFSTSQL